MTIDSETARLIAVPRAVVALKLKLAMPGAAHGSRHVATIHVVYVALEPEAKARKYDARTR